MRTDDSCAGELIEGCFRRPSNFGLGGETHSSSLDRDLRPCRRGFAEVEEESRKIE